MKILLKFGFYLCVLVVLSSCHSKEKVEEFLVIPVNVYQNEPLPLSEITEKIRIIELETTDECLIGDVRLIFNSDDYIIVFDGKHDENKVLLFDATGHFIRRISKRGQGPGEYTHISSVAVDFENKRIYIHSHSYKLMCFDFKGIFVSEMLSFQGEYLNFTNNKLTAIVSSITAGDITDYKINTVFYEISNDLQTVDSMVIYSRNRDDYFYGYDVIKNYLTYTDGNMYFFYPLLHEKDFSYRDTLYQFNDNSLTPHLRLKFSDESSKPFREITQLYRSSRYVFARCFGNKGKIDCFCYDMKTEKGTNMRWGYIDDMHTGEQVYIYPFDSDTNRFYFTYTNMDESDDEEPNPTLYIGTLKK